MTRTRLTLAALGAPAARRYRGLRTRLRVRRAWAASRPGQPAALPEPFLYGDADRGRDLVAGLWAPLGEPVELAGRSIWEAPVGGPRLEAARHGFGWLDDLAALGNRAARAVAQDWTSDWIRRFGKGRGPGWHPELAGARTLALTAHARFLAEGLDEPAARLLWRALAAHGGVLAQGWEEAPAGLPRIRALVGAVLPSTVLPSQNAGEAVGALGRLAEDFVDEAGGTASRAPSDLAEAAILLVWTARLLESAGRGATAPHLHAIGRAVPVLRALRLGDGSMPRFHGGGPGDAVRLDQALAELRLGPQQKPRLPMGYARLAGGRLIAVMDAAVPQYGPAALRAGAGTLAFELSIGREPVVVNAGPGAEFGLAEAAEARTTAAHSTVEIAGASSARLAAPGLAARAYGPWLADGPQLVTVRQAQDHTGQWLLATHDGYVPDLGLLHERRLFADARGREFRGEEIVYVTDGRTRDTFDRMAAARGAPVTIAARFHLHPRVTAVLDPTLDIVELLLGSGDPWVFRAAGGPVGLVDTVHYDAAVARPLPSQAIVVTAGIADYLGQINWSFNRLSAPQAPPRAGPRAPSMP